MTQWLSGKTAVITGSTQGLGLAIAERLAQSGCGIVLNGFAEDEEITAIRRRIEEQSGRQCLYCATDLYHPDQIQRMIGDAVRAFGTVDIVVNNAVVRHQAPVEQFSPSDWDESLAVNLSAAFHTIRLTLAMMRKSGWGRIINLSSIYGLRGAANRVGYVTTKTALIGLTRAVAMETAGQNITCNAICPGTARTPIHEKRIEERMRVESLSFDDAERALLAGKQPTGKLIAPEHIAGLALFLCGPEGDDITGAIFPVDGGWGAA